MSEHGMMSVRGRRLLAGTLLMLSAACATIAPLPSGESTAPPPERAAAAAPVRDAPVRAAPVRAAIRGPLGLEEAVGRALRDNPSLREAAARIDAARASERASRAAWLPRVGFASELTYTDNPVMAFMGDLNAGEWDPGADPNDPEATSHLRLGLALSTLLYDGGQRSAARRSAELASQVAVLQSAIAERELGAAAVSAWLAVHEAQARLELAQSSLVWTERELEAARLREREGAGLASDALSLEVRRSQAEEAVIRAGNARRLALEGLRRLVGAAPDEPVEVSPVPETWPIPPMVEPSIERALAGRDELGTAARSIEMAQEGIRAASRTNRPRVSFIANGWLDGGDPILEVDRGSWLAGLSLDWSLFDGGARGARTEVARARMREAMARLDGLQQQVIEEIRRAALMQEDALARLTSTEAAVRSAGEALRLVELEYAEGAATIARELEAEAALSAARARHVSARFDALRARVELRRTHGLRPLAASESPSEDDRP